MRSLSTPAENTVLIQFISETKIKFPFGRLQDFFYLVFNKYVYELWHTVMNTHIIVRHLYMACAIYWEYIVWHIATTSKVASTLYKIQKFSQLMTRHGCTTLTWLPGSSLVVILKLPTHTVTNMLTTNYGCPGSDGDNIVIDIDA